MADTLPTPAECCSDCDDPITTAIPGPTGPAGTNGTNGTDGIDVFSLIDGSVVVAVPAYGATTPAPGVTLKGPAGNKWMGVDQTVFCAPYGYFQVIALTGTTQATLKNLGDGTLYPGNVNNGVNFADNTKVTPAGVTGPAGAAGAGGAPTTSTYITQTHDAALTNSQALGILGTGLMFSTTATGVVTIKTVGIAASNIAPVDAGAALTSGRLVSVLGGGLKSNTASEVFTLIGLGTIATQNANSVNITGGAISATTIAGSTGSFTSLAASGNATFTGLRATPSTAVQTVAAANLIAVLAAKIKVAGSGGPVVMTSTPTITLGTIDGQEVLIQGTDNTNTVALQDNGSLAGSKLKLGASSRVLGQGDNLRLTWDATDAMWYETSFTNVV